jgi:hypothetical protein
VSHLFITRSHGRSGARRTRANYKPLVLFYGSNEATCSSFVTQQIRRTARQSEVDYESDEAWLYQFDVQEPAAQLGTVMFGRSQTVREFVAQVLSKFSPNFRSFNWSFEPYGCSIRLSDEVPLEEESPTRWRAILSNSIMRYFQESKRPFRISDQSRVIVDSSGHLVETRAKRTRITPDFRELLMSSKVISPLPRNLESCVAEIRLTPRILIRRVDGTFLLSQLSDGEKRLFSLFVDIARQLSIQREFVQPNVISAIVLIDEIDVHLHPKWQRLIVPALEDLFPACQFIATTHSPFVVQGVAEHNVQHLNGSLLGDFTDRGIEEIAFKVMGIEEHQVGSRYLEMLDTAKEYFRVLEEASERKIPNAQELGRLNERLASLTQRYARNPAYQAYLELHRALALGADETP